MKLKQRLENLSLAKSNSKNIAFFGLIVIFCILLIQSTLSLFTELKIEELAQIDVVFRTSISSIFGYMMSMVSTSDFVLKPKVKTQPTAPPAIGFSPQESTKSDASPKAVTRSAPPPAAPASAPLPISTAPMLDLEKKNFAVNVQIIVLTAVCIFCLLVLLIVRNFSMMIVPNDSNSTTLAMFRDIISGSVGALIGLSRSSS